VARQAAGLIALPVGFLVIAAFYVTVLMHVRDQATARRSDRLRADVI